MTTMFCPHCGTELSSEFNFCPKCGKAIGFQGSASSAQPISVTDRSHTEESKSLASELVICPTCGFQNSADARSCESCGTFLKTSASGQKSAPETHRHQAQTNKHESNLEIPQVSREGQDTVRHPGRQRKTKGQKSESRSELSIKRESKFHLQSYQIVSIIAALLLGGILVYGLMSSKPVPSQQDNSGGNSQQQASTTQPSADVLHEIDRLRQIVDKNPDDLVSTLRLSNMLQDNGMYDQAIIYYKRYLDKIPDNVDARVDYGVTLYEGGHTQEAVDELNQSTKMDPKHQKAFFNLGIVYLNAGEIDKSNDAFKKCVQIDPQSDIGKQAEQIMEQHVNIKN